MSAPKPPRMVSAASYRRVHMLPIWRPLLPAPYVAVVPIHGTILLDPRPGGEGASVAGLTRALDAVRQDRFARAVVLHVNSPGGSALASDHIHRAVTRLAAAKPVVASFGDVAASGGYYVAAPARRIFASDATITGSIGVISVRPVISELLQHLGVRPHLMTTAPHADMFSLTRPLDEAERTLWERQIRGTYRRFLEVVAAGRGRDVKDIEAVAEGRVWSGAAAVQNGLVDQIGSLTDAIAEARVLATSVADHVRPRMRPVVIPVRASARSMPNASKVERDAAVAAWLEPWSPTLASLWAAASGGERVLLLSIDAEIGPR